MAKKRIKIYTVHVVYLDLKAASVWSRLRRQRMWGYFKDLKTAEACVLENWTDIYENGYYNFALINEMEEGVVVSPNKQNWYKVTYVKKANNPKVVKLKFDPLNEGSTGGRCLIVW